MIWSGEGHKKQRRKGETGRNYLVIYRQGLTAIISLIYALSHRT